MSNLNSELEITTRPEILYNSSYSITQIEIHGLKIGDSASLIPKESISTTTFHQIPIEIKTVTYMDNKVFLQTDNGMLEYPLGERIKSVLNHGGIMHMKTGAKYVIKGNKIIGMGIHGDIVSPFQSISKKNIKGKFGKALKILETHEHIDGTLFYTEFIYDRKGRLVIHFDDWDKKIAFINLGEFN